MAFKKKFDGQTDSTIQLGDKNNPVRQSIEGYYLGTKVTPDTGYGPGKLHIFQTAEGAVGVWGKSNSNRLMTDDLRGYMVRLTFTGMGEKKKGKNPAYLYELEVDHDESMDVGGINLNAQEEEPEAQEEIQEEIPAPRTAFKATAPAVVAPVSSGVNPAAQAKIQALLNARKKLV